MPVRYSQEQRRWVVLHCRHALHLAEIKIAGLVFRSAMPEDLHHLSESVALELPKR